MSLPSFKNRISSHSLSTESKMWDDMMMHVPESASFLRISECKSTLLGSSAFMGSSNRRYRAPVAYAIARVSCCFMPWLRVRITHLRELAYLRLFHYLFDIASMRPHIANHLEVIFRTQSGIQQRPLTRCIEDRRTDLSRTRTLHLIQNDAPVHARTRQTCHRTQQRRLSMPVRATRP